MMNKKEHIDDRVDGTPQVTNTDTNQDTKKRTLWQSDDPANQTASKMKSVHNQIRIIREKEKEDKKKKVKKKQIEESTKEEPKKKIKSETKNGIIKEEPTTAVSGDSSISPTSPVSPKVLKKKRKDKGNEKNMNVVIGDNREKKKKKGKGKFDNIDFYDEENIQDVLVGNGTDSVQKKKPRWAELSGDFQDLAEMMHARGTAISTAALLDQNLYKNRYGNVLPNAATIVQLKNGSEGSYINANHIKGVEDGMYIASQAPLPNTFNDFWLMIWEQRVKLIVMLTKLQENNKPKAEVYWPTRGALGQTVKAGKKVATRGRFESYGKVSVCLEKSKKLDEEITIRYFAMKWNSEEKNWSDGK